MRKKQHMLANMCLFRCNWVRGSYWSTDWDKGYRTSLGAFCKVFFFFAPGLGCHWSHSGSLNSGPLSKASAPFLAALLGNVRQQSAEEKHSGERQRNWSSSLFLASSGTIGKSLFLVLVSPPVKWVDLTWGGISGCQSGSGPTGHLSTSPFP